MTCCRLSPEQGGNDSASKGARDRGTNSTDATWALYVLDVLTCAPASNRTEQDDGDTIIPRGGGRLELTPTRWGLIPSWWKKTAEEAPSTQRPRRDGSGQADVPRCPSFDYVTKLFCQSPEPVEHPARVAPKLP